jgi:hypothetical protein
MEQESFEAGQQVGWNYIFGSARIMDPGYIRIMLHWCLLLGCNIYTISRTEDVPEENRGSVGHHKFVWILHPKTGEEVPQQFSGVHFKILTPAPSSLPQSTQ